MSDSILYIHVGPSKTATTFLQRGILGRIESAACLPVPEIAVKGRRLRFGDLFSLSPEFWRGLEANPLADRVPHSAQDVVISDERISGGLVAPQPWIPGSIPGRGLPPSPRLHTHSRVDPYCVSSHFRQLRRAADAWGYERVRVLLTPRRQDTKLASSYAQLSNRVRGAGQQNFETWVRHLLHDVIGHNKGGGVKLDYSLWWRELGTAVGMENVFFLPFELLRENRAAFLQEWLGFLGVPEANSIVDALSGSEGAEQNVRSRSTDTWILRTPIKTHQKGTLSSPVARFFAGERDSTDGGTAGRDPGGLRGGKPVAGREVLPSEPRRVRVLLNRSLSLPWDLSPRPAAVMSITCRAGPYLISGIILAPVVSAVRLFNLVCPCACCS